jgi:ribosomal protein S18 acetylase RimI-like enzyme
MTLPLGWHTDLAVLRLTGSTIEQRPDHLLVRTPANPLYYWGNFVLVTDPDQVDEPRRWLELFEQEVPDADHRAIGLVAQPRDQDAWRALDLELDHDDVLSTDHCPEPSDVPAGYLVKQIVDAIEWEQSTGLRVDEFAPDNPRESQFERNVTEARRAMSEAGHVAWFGAFHGDRLAAELGIVDYGEGVARYQAVVTQADHRRRGLAGHLLGVAAQWAAERGARTWVIVAEDGSDASRLYRGHGFEPAAKGTRAQRKPSSTDLA